MDSTTGYEQMSQSVNLLLLRDATCGTIIEDFGMDGKLVKRAGVVGLLAFQASLGFLMFGVYGRPLDFPPGFPFSFEWWPIEVGVFVVPFVAGLVLPAWRMLAAVLLLGAIGAIVPAVVLHGWSWLPPIATIGLSFSWLSALLFGVAVMLREGAGRGLGFLARQGSAWAHMADR